ncbi:hypothetical protein AMATHDRAFT_53961 [Amanita thiersii Skay4041]|uniref:Zinc-finger domain-containing protein n=1 Tax=Amanita thiersii Skay4041 TaxID=703135 RepID=A0A2A9NVH3_9AGAR|nr:hypothetical protein AMATHDRAFT_53961 [Amanita thiersii Skay4041]
MSIPYNLTFMVNISLYCPQVNDPGHAVQSQGWSQSGSHGVSAEQVDVDSDMSSSAQVTLAPRKQEGSQNQEDVDERDYQHYVSPLSAYPLLRSFVKNSNTEPEAQHHMDTNTLPFLSDSLPSRETLSSSSSSFFDSTQSLSANTYIPDLKLLKLASTSKRLDPSKRICQYEVPGGGICWDDKCQEVHLSRLFSSAGSSIDRLYVLDGVEPDDKDTAEYLFYNLPEGWLKRCNIKSPTRILSALEEVGLDKTSGPHMMVLEERVRRALAVLEPVPPLPRPPE